MNARLALFFVSLCGIANALHLPVVARRHQHEYSGAIWVQKTRLDQNVENERDVVYATNITLGGQNFPIQLDTGSSDVWVLPPTPLNLTNTTDIQANLTFGIGQVTGNVAFADMTLGPHTVPSQAILNATNATDFGAIFSNNIYGILGLSFDLGSTVFLETIKNFGRNDTQGLSFMSRVFAQNTSAPNMFTVLLGRSYDEDGPEEGAFTIGEYVDGFEDVGMQTKLYRTPAQIGTNITDTPRWSVVMDSMRVNGKAFQFNASNVDTVQPGQQVVVLDTGFTFSQIPPAAVDFIYSSIPGAQFNATSGLWVVPCENTTELVFEFGGQNITIHPLDITTVTSNGNQTICTNAYRGINLPPGAVTGFDFILGDSFLKNVYTSFDYGDWTPNNATAGVPFVQMLGTTSRHAAKSEFAAVRMSQVQKNNAALANSTTGSLALDVKRSAQASLHTLAARLSRERMRVTVVTHARPSFGMVPLRVVHHAAGCVTELAAAFGPVAVALLVGTFTLVLAMLAVVAVLGVRHLLRQRRARAGYAPLDGDCEVREAEVVFDAEDYNHHVMTQQPATVPPPPYP
ncbi:A1 family peptidase [Phanerochaete sordida]|uniref:A1 family peptidase n=1 Tax=Phanerochaete sordida TaxID=48140 RepID=A0A9P3LEF7_9APHY|nr:A1 family peptidase [Phanerochaete sordida]